MIQPGVYAARAVGPHEVQYGTSRKGDEQVAVLFDLLENGAPSGQRLSWVTTFASKEAYALALRGLKAAGWDGEDVTELKGLGSRDCELVVEHRQNDKGQTRAAIKYVNEPGGGRIRFEKQLDAGAKAAFRDKVRAFQLANASGGGDTASGGEDLPF